MEINSWWIRRRRLLRNRFLNRWQRILFLLLRLFILLHLLLLQMLLLLFHSLLIHCGQRCVHFFTIFTVMRILVDWWGRKRWLLLWLAYQEVCVTIIAINIVCAARWACFLLLITLFAVMLASFTNSFSGWWMEQELFLLLMHCSSWLLLQNAEQVVRVFV